MSEQQLESVPVLLDGGRRAVVQAYIVGAAGEQEVASLRATFDTVADSVRDMSGRLFRALEQIAPQRATLEMGFDVAFENGALVAMLVKASGTASIKVILEWERDAAGAPLPPPTG